ncbi:MAG: hypothetical protein BJ554DRAFT_7903 [Olpidium bornovanus]|uniref:MHD domain-containing protein n=1 Tax=Olpidium bornovanus TaxID=278681 RepID=A0A8H7ZUX8_9FUNG|nr:MAG: hypothetical protein BJ554DRAFT_7903 [Olpidium bornovanus]
MRFVSCRSTISTSASLPLSLRPQMTNTPTGGKFDLVLSPRTTDGKPIEDVVVVYRMSHAVDKANFSCNVGQQSLDVTTKTLTWAIGKVSVQERIPMLSGTFTTK